MKTYILIAVLFASAMAQDSLDATQMTQEMNAAQVAADQAAIDAEYDEKMKAFQNSIESAILNHQSATKNVKVGDFEIIVQENCTIEFPKKPEKPTVVEKECFKAQANAETTAELIAKATPLNPPNVQMVQGAMNSCELQVGIIKTFEIFNTCWEDDLGPSYRSIYEAQVESLKSKGYTLNEDTGKWEKRINSGTINIAQDGDESNTVTPAP
jgi:hypothetical protein